MNHVVSGTITLCLLLVLTLGGGCKENVAPPTPIPADQLPAALEKAFAKAKAEAKDLSAQVITSIQGQDYSKAYFAMQTLATKPGLNKEQLRVTTGGLMTLNELLQAAQSKGDAKAGEVLKFHRENK